MDQVVVLSFGTGGFHSGFPAVTAQLWGQTTLYPIKFTGSLPAAPNIPELYRQWRLLYLALYQRLDQYFRIEIEAADITNVSAREFSDLCQQLSGAISTWLNAESFCSVVQPLRTHLDIADDIRFIIESDDILVQRLPWHLWPFFDDYHHAEVALSAPTYQRSPKQLGQATQSKAQVLAILGNSHNLDIQTDRTYLEQLSFQADITFLVEPTRDELNHQLWQPWNVLFFAGHSFSQQTGVLRLNATDELTLEQLRYALKQAIAQGLELAIFNSCDGLGLAQSLADLHIPQVIVMREPVPDQVAQQFLRHFLTAFSNGQSLYRSVREARERLQGLENDYPCAAWLPVIFQNPAEVPPYWHDWSTIASAAPATSVPSSPEPPSRLLLISGGRRLRAIMGISLMVAALVMGLRHTGLLQRWELQAFDQLMRSRPSEPPDPRLLVIAITEQDLQLSQQQQRTGSLSDQALSQLLETLEPLQPRAIGLDIYRDFPAQDLPHQIATQLRTNDRLFATCKVRDAAIDHPGIAPPPEVPIERQGFSDIVKDGDDVLRRHLLALNPHPISPCQTPYALSAQLAFHYLAADGMALGYTIENQLIAGDVMLQRLRRHRGGYQRLDAWGYQVLLNYRNYRSIADMAPTLTLSEALSGNLRFEDVNDRVVLIGVTASSAGDYLATPYSSGFHPYREIPGVIAQAQMVSQILSAVYDGRPLLQTWPWWADGGWVWGWGGVGGALVGYGYVLRRQPLLAAIKLINTPSLYLILVGGVTVGGLYLTCLILLIQGYWVPFIPATLASMLTGSAIASLLSQSASQLNHRSN